MSVESALTYIRRMRSDNDFRLQVVDLSDNETASWQFLKQNGYEFTMEEFRAAQDAIYKEYGLTPM
jgi:predicted ribosomally synthesized peptide with nif11-like leader